jgi:hypothetical protein
LPPQAALVAAGWAIQASRSPAIQSPNANGGRHRCRPPLPPPSGGFLRQTVPSVRKRAIRGAKPLRPLPGRCLRIPSATDASCIRAGSCRRGRAALVPAAGLAAMGGRFSFVSGHRSLGSSRERRAVGRTPAGLKDRRCVPLSPWPDLSRRVEAEPLPRDTPCWRHRCTRLTDLSGHTSSLRRARMIPCGRLKRVLSRSGLWRKTPEFIGLRFRFRVAFPFDKPMLRLRSESRKRKPWKLSTGDRFCGGQLEPAPSERPVFVS